MVDQIIRSSRVKNLVPRLPERGHIKIGRKGAEKTAKSGNTYQAPEKLDHFIITTNERGKDGNFVTDEKIHGKLGEKPTRIPVKLIYDDPELSFVSRLASYAGMSLWCSGDGEIASRQTEDKKGRTNVACPCHRFDFNYQGPDKCKINGSLQVIVDLPDVVGVGGIWRFRTTSFNSVSELTGGLEYISTLTGGVLAGIPLDLVLSPKHATDPAGKTVTVYVVSLDVREGVNVDGLRELAKLEVGSRVDQKVSIQQIEERARKMLALPLADGAVLHGDEPADIVEEFYVQPPEVKTAAVAMADAAAQASPHDKETGEIIEPWTKIVGAKGAGDFSEKLLDLLNLCKSEDDVNAVMRDNGRGILRLDTHVREQVNRLRQIMLSRVSTIETQMERGDDSVVFAEPPTLKTGE